MGEGHKILSRPLLLFFPPLSDSGPMWFLADTTSHFLLKEYTQFAIFKPHFPHNLFSSKPPHPLNDERSFFYVLALKLFCNCTQIYCSEFHIWLWWLSWLLEPGEREEREYCKTNEKLQLKPVSGAMRRCRIPPLPHSGSWTHFCLAGHLPLQ